jgi:hypothetical protein
MLNELYALAVAAFVGPVALDGDDCGVKYTPEGFRPNCEEFGVYHSKYTFPNGNHKEYAFDILPGGYDYSGKPNLRVVPPGLIDNPACERSQGRPPFCDDYPSYPPVAPEVPAVPLPAAVWMLLVAVGSLVGMKRVKK